MRGLPIATIMSGVDDRLRHFIANHHIKFDDGFSVSLRFLVVDYGAHLFYERNKIRYNVDPELLENYREEMVLIAKTVGAAAPLRDKGWRAEHQVTLKNGHVFHVGTSEYIQKMKLD